jgi:hypothetical protein
LRAFLKLDYVHSRTLQRTYEIEGINPQLRVAPDTQARQTARANPRTGASMLAVRSCINHQSIAKAEDLAQIEPLPGFHPVDIDSVKRCPVYPALNIAVDATRNKWRKGGGLTTVGFAGKTSNRALKRDVGDHRVVPFVTVSAISGEAVGPLVHLFKVPRGGRIITKKVIGRAVQAAAGAIQADGGGPDGDAKLAPELGADDVLADADADADADTGGDAVLSDEEDDLLYQHDASTEQVQAAAAAVDIKIEDPEALAQNVRVVRSLVSRDRLFDRHR